MTLRKVGHLWLHLESSYPSPLMLAGHYTRIYRSNAIKAPDDEQSLALSQSAKALNTFAGR